MRTKICNSCGAELPIKQFYKHGISGDGYRSCCIPCMKSQRKAKYVSKAKKQKKPVEPRTITSIPRYVTKVEKVAMIGTPGAKFVVQITCDNGETYTKAELANIFDITREGIGLRLKKCGLNNDIIFLEKEEYKKRIKKMRGEKFQPVKCGNENIEGGEEWSKLGSVVRSWNLKKMKPIGSWELNHA